MFENMFMISTPLVSERVNCKSFNRSPITQHHFGPRLPLPSYNSNSSIDFTLTAKDIAAFKKLIEERSIQEFFRLDSCNMLADKYLIASTLIYFKRASFLPKNFTYFNFFTALYLAHDMEEDDLDLKNDLIKFAIGDDITETLAKFFISKKDKMWHSMDFRSTVSRISCEYIIKTCFPEHSVWKRTRCHDHGGVNIPFHLKEKVHKCRIGFGSSRIRCIVCESVKFLKNYSPLSNKSIYPECKYEEVTDLERFYTIKLNI